MTDAALVPISASQPFMVIRKIVVRDTVPGNNKLDGLLVMVVWFISF